MLNEGKSKLRGRKEGGLDKNLKWSTIAITTGEEPLVDTTHHSGAKNRVLDIYGKPFDNEQQAKSIYRITKTEFGTAGPVFIEKLIKEYADNEYKELAKEYDSIEEELSNKVSKDTISSYIQSIASIVLADSLIGKYFFNTNLESSTWLLQVVWGRWALAFPLLWEPSSVHLTVRSASLPVTVGCR